MNGRVPSGRCSYLLDRGDYHRTLLGGLPRGCQFGNDQELVFDRQGKPWCRFHLPADEKVNWSSEEAATFDRNIRDIVDNAVRRPALLDLSGVVFPRSFKLGTRRKKLTLPNTLLMDCVFLGEVQIENVTFSGWSYFCRTRFLDQALLHGLAYKGEANFSDVDFGPNVHLGDSHFQDNAYFQCAKFPNNAWCSDIRFAGRAWFQSAQFGGYAYLERCIFGGEADFSTRSSSDPELAFQIVSFEESIFRDRASFMNRVFADSTNFARVVFHVAPEFHGCRLHQDTDLSDTVFHDKGSAERSVICGVYPRPVDAARAYRTLKYAMEQLRNPYDEARFLALERGTAEALSTSLPEVRSAPRGQKSGAANGGEKRDTSPGAQLDMLFVSANPDRNSPLHVEKEQSRIAKVRNGSRHQSLIAIESLPDADLPELVKSLRLHNPTVVHFAGHGEPDGALLMRDENGRKYEMHAEGIAQLILLEKSTVRLVFLNACYSSRLAELLVPEIDCVIGMNDEVSDGAAILFAQVFYGALFDGVSVARAFQASSAAVCARYRDESNVPEIKSKAGVDLDNVRLIGDTAP